MYGKMLEVKTLMNIVLRVIFKGIYFWMPFYARINSHLNTKINKH